VRSRAAPHVRRDPTGGSCGRQSPQFRSVSPGLYLRLVGNDDGLTLKPVVFSVYVVDLEVENTARFAPEFRSWAKRSLSGSLFRTFGEQYDSSRDTRTDFIVCARIAFGTRSQPPGDLSITPSGVLCNPNRGVRPGCRRMETERKRREPADLARARRVFSARRLGNKRRRERPDGVVTRHAGFAARMVPSGIGPPNRVIEVPQGACDHRL
jgi:hypothetical protein